MKIGNLEVTDKDLGEMSWADANRACQALGNGWRLPTKEELTTLYENRASISGFSTARLGLYWSSTRIYSTSVWVRGFADDSGLEDSTHDEGDANVRAVRSIEGKSQANDPVAEDAEPLPACSLGIRFNIDRLEGGAYGEEAWKVIWRTISPQEVIGATLYEGDTLATLEDREQVYCIRFDCHRESEIETLRQALGGSAEFRRVAAEPMFISVCSREPLVQAGSIDKTGALGGSASRSLTALNAVAREKAASANSQAVMATATESFSSDSRIRFQCPHCSRKIAATLRSAGRGGKCPGCGGVIHVPTTTSGIAEGEATSVATNVTPSVTRRPGDAALQRLWDASDSDDIRDLIRDLTESQIVELVNAIELDNVPFNAFCPGEFQRNGLDDRMLAVILVAQELLEREQNSALMPLLEKLRNKCEQKAHHGSSLGGASFDSADPWRVGEDLMTHIHTLAIELLKHKYDEQAAELLQAISLDYPERLESRFWLAAARHNLYRRRHDAESKRLALQAIDAFLAAAADRSDYAGQAETIRGLKQSEY